MLRHIPQRLSAISSSGVRFFSTGSKKVAFIGLGNMGMHMMNNLMKGGYEVSAYDIAAPALEIAEKNGATVASSPAAAAEGAHAVITMLPANEHVRHAYLGQNGIFETAAPGTILIDSSTIDPSVSREIATAGAEKKLGFVDAPVSGGVGGAEAGTLTFMVGGEDKNFNTAKDVLEKMGQNIVHCGDVGTGEIAKLCNNMVLGISMIGVSEAMNMGSKLGMDRSKLAGILNTSTARCWSSDTYNPAPGVMEGVPSSRGYTGGFGSALMLKDLGLAADAAKSVKAPIPMGNSAQSFYELLCRNELGDKDFSVAYKFLGGDDVDKKN